MSPERIQKLASMPGVEPDKVRSFLRDLSGQTLALALTRLERESVAWNPETRKAILTGVLEALGESGRSR